MLRWIRATGLRIALATGLSFSLWAFVSFSENPDRRTPYDSVPVMIEGLTPGLIVVDQDGLPRPSLPSVNVTVESDTETSQRVRPSDIRALVDLSSRGPGAYVVPVIAATNRSDLTGLNFEIDPDLMPIRLEQLITSTVPLTVAVSGNLPFSFEQRAPEVSVGGLTVSSVEVRGPQGRVTQVQSVRAAVNIEQLRADYTSLVTLQPLDESQQEVEGVTLQPAAVRVRVPIRSIVGLRRVAVLGSVTGLPAPGYSVTGVSSDPQLVNLTGSSGPLDEVSQIETEPIDVGGATGTFTREVGLRLPFGTSLQASEPSRVVVTVEIAPIRRVFQLALPVPIQAINIGGGLLLSFNPQVVEVRLAGTSAALEQLNNLPLQGSVDLSGYGPGSYSLQPKVPLPAGISIVGEVPMVSVILRLQPSATAAPSRTSESVPTVAPTSSTVAATPLPGETPEVPTEPPAAPSEPPASPAPPAPATPSPATEATTTQAIVAPVVASVTPLPISP